MCQKFGFPLNFTGCGILDTASQVPQLILAFWYYCDGHFLASQYPFLLFFFFFFFKTAAWYPFWDLFIPFSETITQGVLTFSLQTVVIETSLLVFLWDCISWEVLQKGERTCLISGLCWWWILEEASVSSCYLDPWNCLYSYFFPDEQMLLRPSLQVIKLLTSIAVFCLR